jgi:hypothetical protein
MQDPVFRPLNTLGIYALGGVVAWVMAYSVALIG